METMPNTPKFSLVDKLSVGDTVTLGRSTSVDIYTIEDGYRWFGYRSAVGTTEGNMTAVLTDSLRRSGDYHHPPVQVYFEQANHTKEYRQNAIFVNGERAIHLHHGQNVSITSDVSYRDVASSQSERREVSASGTLEP